MYLWRAVDEKKARFLTCFQERRNTAVALKLLRKLLKKSFRRRELPTAGFLVAIPRGVVGITA